MITSDLSVAWRKIAAVLSSATATSYPLDHFQHESAAVAEKIVTGPNAAEYPIDYTNTGICGRDEAASLRQNSD